MLNLFIVLLLQRKRNTVWIMFKFYKLKEYFYNCHLIYTNGTHIHHKIANYPFSLMTPWISLYISIMGSHGSTKYSSLKNCCRISLFSIIRKVKMLPISTVKSSSRGRRETNIVLRRGPRWTTSTLKNKNKNYYILNHSYIL